MAISLTLATIGGDEGSWGSKTNQAFTTIADAVNGTSGTIAPNLDTLTIGGTNVTSTALEINKLDGFTGTFTDLNYAKDLRATGVSLTEFDYLEGVSSNIQTQLDALSSGKQANITGGATTIDTEDLTTNRVLISNGSGKVAAANVTSTELGVLDGGTSATSTTVAASDRVVFNDNGTMKQVSMSDIATYTSAQVSSPTVSDATITLEAGNDLSGGGTITLNQSSNETVTFSHGNTSNLNGATSNSGSNYIQNITVDDNGHVTAITATDAASNISVSGGFNSAGSVTGASVRSSTQVSFSGGISVPNGKTIFGWSSDQTNMALVWRNNWQGNINTLTNYGNPFTNNTGSAVTVYGWVNTSGSASRSAVYMMFG